MENVYLNAMLAAARRAAEEVRRALAEGYGCRSVGIGASGDETLAIDRLSEEAVLLELRERIPEGFALLGEERGYVTVGDGSGGLFIVDPVDGSFNAKRGIPLYSVSIARAEGKRLSDISEAVVMLVPTGDTFYAVRGRGAYLNGSRVRPSGVSTLKGSVVDVTMPSKAGTAPVRIVEKLVLRGAKVRVLGSASVEACYTACGVVDGYVDAWGTLRVVDFAAAYLILRESGAYLHVEGRLFTPPVLSLDERLNVVAAASPQLGSELLKIIGSD